MIKIGRQWCLLLLSLPLACSSKSTMNLSTGGDAGTPAGAEAGLSDALVGTPEDAKTTVVDTSLIPDLAVARDDVASTPDARKTDSAPPGADVAPDLSRSDGPAVKADADGATKTPDADAVTKTPDALVIALDGKTPPDAVADTAKADATKDLGLQNGDAGVVVSGVQVLPYKDYGSADSTCVDGTASWLAALSTYLAEDRKCWSDADCQYVSFSNSCGQVCPVPMNIQRIGEFANHAIGDLDPKCSTCPVLTDYPICSSPPGDGSVICSGGLCVWK